MKYGRLRIFEGALNLVDYLNKHCRTLIYDELWYKLYVLVDLLFR